MRDGGRGGSIILLSSIDSLYAAPGGEGIYGACKAAINNITPTMAVELGQHQIRVNAIAPAAVETPADRALAGDGGRPPGALRLLSAPPSGPAGGRRRCCRVLRLRRGRVGVGIDPAGVRRRGADQRPISLSHARQPRADVSCARKSVHATIRGRIASMQVYAFDLLPWPHLDAPSYYPDANALFDPVRGREVYAQHLDQMAMCEEYGFDAICMNEHHSKPYGLMPSPNIIAAALTQRTRRIKIGILGTLPALHGHPVRLAEAIAMLDFRSNGRIVTGFVRGVPQ